jgi:DNA transformation protein and related proteins
MGIGCSLIVPELAQSSFEQMDGQHMTHDEIADFFAEFGPVTSRKMFGGMGIYRDGLMFALEAYGEIMLKADAESAPEFQAAGSRQFVYEGKGKPVAMSYWTVPEDAVDDPEARAKWAEKAYRAALRSRK